MLEKGQWQAKVWEKFAHLKKSIDYFVLGKKKKMWLITSLTWRYSLHPELERTVADLVQTDSNGAVNIRAEML